jgi:hypothetical protein
LGTEEVAGSGIGLSIVKTVVQQYKGSVHVDSSPGAGSTFYVRLPVLPDAPELVEDDTREASRDQKTYARRTLVGSEERST